MSNGFDGTEALTYHERWRVYSVLDGFWSEQCIDIDGEGYFPSDDRHFTAKIIRTDQGLAVRLSGHVPEDVIDCVAEVRNVVERELNIRSVRLPKVALEHLEKHGTIWGDIDWEGEPKMDPADVVHPPNVDDAMKYQMADDEHLGSCDPYDGVDETQMGCADEIAQELEPPDAAHLAGYQVAERDMK